MTDMIEAEPAIAARILERHEAVGSGAAELARVIRRTVRSGDRVVVTGCGTSEHGALGVAEILRDAIRTADVRPPGHAARHEPVAAQAFELSLDPPSTGLVIGVSHEGGNGCHQRRPGSGKGRRCTNSDHHGHRPLAWRGARGCRRRDR
jgi:fructoselysine-6-P-deglycase FrlB-like protein